MPTPISQEVKDQAIQMKRQGLPAREIAKTLKIGESSVSAITKGIRKQNGSHGVTVLALPDDKELPAPEVVYPLIGQLMAREDALAEAIEKLHEAGINGDSIATLLRARSYSPLEEEIVRLVRFIRTRGLALG